MLSAYRIKATVQRVLWLQHCPCQLHFGTPACNSLKNIVVVITRRIIANSLLPKPIHLLYCQISETKVHSKPPLSPYPTHPTKLTSDRVTESRNVNYNIQFLGSLELHPLSMFVNSQLVVFCQLEFLTILFPIIICSRFFLVKCLKKELLSALLL